MPHKCASCGKAYDNYAVELVRGCECGSKIFIYSRSSDRLSKTTTRLSSDVRREGSLPGPASREKIRFVESSEENSSGGKQTNSTPKEVKAKSKKPNFDLNTIRVVEDGVYDINVNKLLNNEPLIIEITEDGKYSIHLASLFRERMEGELEDEYLEVNSKNKLKRKIQSKKKK